jgi:hypothetical protein
MIIKWRESNSIHLHLKKSLTGQAYGKIQSLFPSKKPAMPARYHVIAAFLFVINSCTDTRDYVAVIPPGPPEIISGEKIREIYVPPGFTYVVYGDTVYADWLLDLKLKKNKTVYLYNGKLKSDQSVQHSVLDIDIGKKDLVQCADAAMKLRSDFLFEKHRHKDLNFVTTSGDTVRFQSWLKGIRWKERGPGLRPHQVRIGVTDTLAEYNRFMEMVFSYCGTYSLSKQLTVVADINSIQPGDVFIKGGFPGHAVTVMAVAENTGGERIFLLSQGYMPAQDIHILKNYGYPELSPWYTIKQLFPLFTPKWKFDAGSLKRWR